MASIRSLRLKFACDEDWHAFAGDAGVRRCETCRTAVHDLSALTRSEATALFRRPPASGLCVRYQHDGMGRILFRSETRPGQRVWQRFVPPAVEAAAPADAGAGEPGGD
ncbi:hypothetical protein SAMN02745121_06717 [Nannocystis exedens]|uniref:Uncharacterized protein n=1 Tax=Nannocystis exedens TaxID=54 RepID=A0A1I2FNJ1_9BACT|nr:hypothetical protein [Nannocystis exedens]PCC74459.1 hypothetical protein NAEX_07555 [Nannocystis exedens]SFF06160.1 hypothetical protein SAMN02745121_06717 [Nannocystis exedens]